jgi:hypothetical protein
MENTETWKLVPGLLTYEVSDRGRIRSIDRVIDCGRRMGKYLKRGIVLRNTITREGYIITSICKEGIQKFYSVHRLVAEAFIPNPEGKAEVNHIDGNKTNNAINNLEWVTRSENHLHAFRTGLRKPPKLREVICNVTGKRFQSVKDAALYLGVANETLRSRLSGYVQNKTSLSYA